MATIMRQTLSVTPSNSTFKSENSQQIVQPSPHLVQSPLNPKCATPHQNIIGYSCSKPRNNRPGRISLSLPVVSIENNSEYIRPVLNSIITPPPTTKTLSYPIDSNSFLVAIAGQERYVFELKEELNKAEKELKRLKKQLALYELSKKRCQSRNIEPLKPVQTPESEENAFEKSLDLIKQDLQAKNFQAARQSLPTPKGLRRKFSGIHTRSLSLVLPEKSNNSNNFSLDSALEDKKTKDININKTSRSSMSSQNSTQESSQDTKILFSPRDMACGAKQLVGLAEGVKEGLKSSVLTFFEDLRQATVGHEGVHGTHTYNNLVNDGRTGRMIGLLDSEIKKRNNLPKVTQSRNRGTLVGSPSPAQTFTEPMNLNEAKDPVIKKELRSSAPLSISTNDELEDAWSNWDSPSPKSERWGDSATTSGSVTPPDIDSFHGDNK